MKESKYKVYLDFIKYAIKDNEILPSNASCIDWSDFLQFCNRHGVIGIVFDGMQRSNLRVNKTILFQWYAYAEKIKKQNNIVNQRVVQAQKFFAEKGYRSCILKGQANGLMYPKPEVRSPGDIDLWVDGNNVDIIKFVLKRSPHAHYSLHHIEFPLFKDVSLEVHYSPAHLNIWSKDKKLQRFFECNKENQFNHKEMLIGTPIGSLTDDFNAVYQILHMWGHFFATRNSFKQFIDYYYLLKRGLSSSEKEKCMQVFRMLGIDKYVSGIMWIMTEILGLDECNIIGNKNEKEGKLILRESFCYGTFSKSVIRSVAEQTMANVRVLPHYPKGVLISPIYLLWHQWWKFKIKRKIK